MPKVPLLLPNRNVSNTKTVFFPAAYPSLRWECLNSALKHRLWLLACPVQGQNLDLMILVCSVQLRVFYGSMTPHPHLTAQEMRTVIWFLSQALTACLQEERLGNWFLTVSHWHHLQPSLNSGYQSTCTESGKNPYPNFLHEAIKFMSPLKPCVDDKSMGLPLPPRLQHCLHCSYKEI